MLTADDQLTQVLHTTVILDIYDGGLTSSSHQSTHCRLDISDVVILAAFSIIVVYIKPDLLSGLEDEVDDETLAEGVVQIVIDCFCSADLSVVFHCEISFPEDSDIWVRLAEDIEVLEVSG